MTEIVFRRIRCSGCDAIFAVESVNRIERAGSDAGIEVWSSRSIHDHAELTVAQQEQDRIATMKRVILRLALHWPHDMNRCQAGVMSSIRQIIERCACGLRDEVPLALLEGM